MRPPSGLAPSLINFVAVQVLYHITRPRFFGGRYVQLGSLPAAGASAYLVGAILGRTHKAHFDDLVKMFVDEPDSKQALSGVVGFLRGKAEERLSLYAKVNADGCTDPESFSISLLGP